MLQLTMAIKVALTRPTLSNSEYKSSKGRLSNSSKDNVLKSSKEGLNRKDHQVVTRADRLLKCRLRFLSSLTSSSPPDRMHNGRRSSKLTLNRLSRLKQHRRQRRLPPRTTRLHLTTAPNRADPHKRASVTCSVRWDKPLARRRSASQATHLSNRDKRGGGDSAPLSPFTVPASSFLESYLTSNGCCSTSTGGLK